MIKLTKSCTLYNEFAFAHYILRHFTLLTVKNGEPFSRHQSGYLQWAHKV